jgi:hypothetical protein
LFGYSYNDDALQDCFSAAVLAATARKNFNNTCKQHTELPWHQVLPKLPMRQFGKIALLLIGL